MSTALPTKPLLYGTKLVGLTIGHVPYRVTPGTSLPFCIQMFSPVAVATVCYMVTGVV